MSTAALKPATFQVAACQCQAVPESRGRAGPSAGTLHTGMPKPVTVTVLGWAIVRFQSRSVLWTSWPEAGSERGGRRQNGYVHKQLMGQIPSICSLCTRSAAVKYTKSMQKITGSNLVCNFFESRNFWYVLVQTSTSQYIQVCIGMCLYELVCTGLYWYVLAYTFSLSVVSKVA